MIVMVETLESDALELSPTYHTKMNTTAVRLL